MRTTLNIKHSSPADLAKQLRSAAAKIDAAALTPGADLIIGNTRVQVAVPEESDIRAWARANADALAAQGIPPVAGRGRYSKALQDAYAAHLKTERKAKRDAAKARREAAKAEAVAV